MDAISQFLLLADAYRAATGLTETTVSTRVFADGKRLTSIRKGGEVGARRLGRSIAWFSAHWPEGVVWPDGIARPAPLPTPANDTAPTPSEDAA